MTRRFASFLRSDSGTASIEFVILFPLFVTMLLMTIEAGIYMARQVLLDRSVDLAVRELRLGTETPPTFEEFKAAICDNSMMIPDCQNVVQVELKRVNLKSWEGVNGAPRCIDVTENIDPFDQTEFTNGSDNELMMVRVCAVYQPFLPSTYLGLQMAKLPGDRYAIVVTSAFVNEPT